MDTTALTEWRLDFLAGLVDTIPQEALDSEPLEEIEPGSGKYPIHVTVHEWLNYLAQQCLWHSHLFPGKDQCTAPGQSVRLAELRSKLEKAASFAKNYSDSKEPFEALLLGLEALSRNRWAFEFLRPDQVTTVLSARKNSSSLGLDYLPVFDATQEEFREEPGFEFFLNSTVFDFKKDGIEGLGNVNLIDAPTGTGKCLGLNTPVLMADGTTKMVQDVVVGDRVMGPDGKGRRVLSLGRGQDDLYQVTPVKGSPYIVNSEHILSLKRTGGSDTIHLADGRAVAPGCNAPVFVTAETLWRSNKNAKRLLKGWRPEAVSFEFESAERIIPPYILGLWLGDGTSSQPELTQVDGVVARQWRDYAVSIGCSVSTWDGDRCPIWRINGPGAGKNGGSTPPNPFMEALRSLGVVGNKHIPQPYLMAPQQCRLELLAGLLDTDGHLDQRTQASFEITQRNEALAEGVVFLCRSLGLAASKRQVTRGIKEVGFEGTYYLVLISGDCSKIPTRLPHKKAQQRKQKKSVLVTGITIQPCGFGDYYGFEIDGDRQFLLGDWQVTHNTRMSLVAGCGHLSVGNDPIPFAPKRIVVFVRTRSQTQAFLKEAKRLGLSVACPISTSLGCQAHDKMTGEFLRNMVSTFRWMRAIAKNDYADPGKFHVGLPKSAYPAEIFQVVANTMEVGQAFANAVLNFRDFTRDIPNDEAFKKRWAADHKGNEPEVSFLRDYITTFDIDAEYQGLVDYLTSDKKCANCPANPSFLATQGITGAVLDSTREFYGQGGNTGTFLRESMDKNADINQLAEGFQRKFGLCGRPRSKDSMDTADVVILTYNWLTDPNIAQHAHEALGVSPHELNLKVSAICDEAHYLYDFDKAQEISAVDVFSAGVDLWRLRSQHLDQSALKLPGIDQEVVNPNLRKRSYKKIDRPEDLNDIQMAWYACDEGLRCVTQIMDRLIENQIPNQTPQTLLEIATGRQKDWYPKALYEAFDPSFDYLERTKNPIEVIYASLQRSVENIRDSVEFFREESKRFETQINNLFKEPKKGASYDDGEFKFIMEDKPKSKGWVQDTFDLWKAGGSRSKLQFRRHLLREACGPYDTIAAALALLESLVLTLREVVYAVGTNQFDDRPMYVSFEQGGGFIRIPFSSWLDQSTVDKVEQNSLAPKMKDYLEFMQRQFEPMDQKERATFRRLPLEELVRVMGSSLPTYLRSLAGKKEAQRVLCIGFKANRPQVQTALRPFAHVNFLTGTPAEPMLWRYKSGFRYFATSEYPEKPNNFTLIYDDRFELKMANRSEDLYRKIAKFIPEYCGIEAALVCYPSKAQMKVITDQMDQKWLDKQLMESNDVQLDDVFRYVSENPTGSVHVVCGGRFVEGVEITDDDGSSLIKRIVIVGVPFNPPTEKGQQAENFFVKKFQFDEWTAKSKFMYQPLKSKILQAKGRCVRNLTDQGRLVLMDFRYKNGKMLRRELNLF